MARGKEGWGEKEDKEGHFDNGCTKEPNVVAGLCIRHKLITKQTPLRGNPVSKVMVSEAIDAIDVTQETYISIAMDRASNSPVIVTSPDSGLDLEEVAVHTSTRCSWT